MTTGLPHLADLALPTIGESWRFALEFPFDVYCTDVHQNVERNGFFSRVGVQEAQESVSEVLSGKDSMRICC